MPNNNNKNLFILYKLGLQFVPDDLKDDKYWARRRKNNMAAKRSRDARRMKENQIALRAGYLEKEVTKFKEKKNISFFCFLFILLIPKRIMVMYVKKCTGAI